VLKKPPAVEANEALADVPWDSTDEDSSIDEELNQADTRNVLEETNGAGGPNDRAGVYSDSVFVLPPNSIMKQSYSKF
jgi:hypothetical protein